MSSQRGNVNRKGAPKHQNKTAFKNNMHDKSKTIQHLNSMKITGLCSRCKDIIDWKIKYKKYKPLTTAKKCVKCEQKTVKQAYNIMCSPCASAAEVCAKCGKAEAVAEETALSEAEKNAEKSRLAQELKTLTERQRRAYFRHVESGQDTSDLLKRFKEDNDDDFDDFDDEFDDDEEEDVVSECSQTKNK